MLTTPSTPCNDNLKSRRLYYKGVDEKGDRSRMMLHIPVAKKLIQRYSEKVWKHTPQDSNYAFLEYQICTLLDEPTDKPASRTMTLMELAGILVTPIISLVNDPDLDFHPTDLARFP